MEKIKTMAGWLDRFFGILFWIFAAGAGILAVLLCVALVQGESGPVYRSFCGNIDLGGLELTLQAAYMPRGAWAAALVWIQLAMVVSGGAGVCWGMRLVRRMLAPMKAGYPFDGTISRNLRRLGLLTMIVGAGMSLLQMAATIARTQAICFADVFQMQAIEKIGVTLHFDVTFLFVSCLLFLLSMVFCYGEQLQQLSDETL